MHSRLSLGFQQENVDQSEHVAPPEPSGLQTMAPPHWQSYRSDEEDTEVDEPGGTLYFAVTTYSTSGEA